jgi:type VI secretion system secreted protein Hcp
MAYEFYVTIEGTRTGRFHGESPREAHRDKITGLEFFYEVASPRDPATGQATGRRQHKPITITKEWGAASPQIFQALVNNESLKSVLFEFVDISPEGTEMVSHTIRLRGATISAYRQYIGNVENFVFDSTRDSLKLENVSFTFQKIEITNIPAQTTATDDAFGARQV